MDARRLTKKELRSKVAQIKRLHTNEQLMQFSEDVIELLEMDVLFEKAKTIFVYHSLPDEVNTRHLIEKYTDKKRFILPVVCGYNLVLKEYIPQKTMCSSSYGILEPEGADFIRFNEIDLVLVPGVAFDRRLNRLGRGKGFYDRLLPDIKAPKIGLCFDFQLFDEIHADANDIKMDKIISQFELIL